MTLTYFTITQNLILSVGAISIIASVILFQKQKRTAALISLTAAASILGFFMACLDPFLVLWDEQFHALVAKNMISHPFRPMLYSIPLHDYYYQDWTANHIWLHKQPLFLWQIALSLKLFGINEIAVRIPSLFMHALIPFIIYRMGKLSVNAQTGFYGALFFCVARFPLELAAGKYATDHNDLSFLFYVTASFWSWFEYNDSGKKSWLISIGIFAGGAVLVKWLVGLLVFAAWGIAILLNNKAHRPGLKAWYPLAGSLVIAFIVFIPWQLYTHFAFPVEARYESNFNTRHFFVPVENHSGDIWFHFKAIGDIYGGGFLVPLLILTGLAALFLKTGKGPHRTVIFSSILITYCFYTIAATKMTSFCIIVAPFIFLGFGALADMVFTQFRSIPGELKGIALIIISFFLFDLPQIEHYHTSKVPDDNHNRIGDLQQMKMISTLKETLKDERFAVFNADVRDHGHIAVMFYTDYIAYDFVPNAEHIQKARQQGYNIAIIDQGDLPERIAGDSSIIKIGL